MRCWGLVLVITLISVSVSAQQIVSDGQHLWGFTDGGKFAVGTILVPSGSNFVWYGSVDVAWTNKANWTNIQTGANGEPSSYDTVIFNNAGNGKTAIGYDGGFRAFNNIIATNSAMAAYNLGSNTTESIKWTSGGSIIQYGNVGNSITIGGSVYIGSASGEVTNYITTYSQSKSVTLSVSGGRLMATNGNVVLVLNAVSNIGTAASINLAGQLKKNNGNISKIIKLGAGLVNIGSGTSGNTVISDIYLNQGALSIVGGVGNLIAGNRLFINTNTVLLSVNQPSGNYTGITNYWNGDFNFNAAGYFGSFQQMTFTDGFIDLGQYGTDTIRTVGVSNSTFTINCPITNGSNGTTISLAKSGASGTLVLGGTNTYTGATYVLSGTLRTSISNAILSSSTIYITNSAVMNLNFAGTNFINKLYLAGTSMATSVYGATNTASTNFLTGTGFLSVTNGP